jgi:hypothetical protein
LRIAFLFGAALLAGCTPQSQKASPTADAALARETVQSYFDLISQKKFDDAYRLWANGGADTRGTAADFAKTFEPYATYVAEVGDATEIKTSTGQDYISVATKVRVRLKQTGRTLDRSGPVMLRRSTRSNEPWRIWGTDIRSRN